MNKERLRWLFFRLRSMEGRELLHRMMEFAKRAIDRQRSFHFSNDKPSLPLIPGLRETVREASPELREQIRVMSGRLEKGKYKALGQDWPQMGNVPDWHLDPVTGKKWPSDQFCFSIAFRHNSSLGDVKYVWELNRLQHLQVLAAEAVCFADTEAARTCALQIRSWIAANPPFIGINWVSGIEVALRLVSIVIVVTLIPESFSPTDRCAINAMLQAHLYWLSRYPSLYSSANNHLVAEAGALFVGGSAAPYLPEAVQAADRGIEILNEEGLKQILPDGVPAEQSPTYGAFTAEWLLVAEWVAAATKTGGLTKPVLERLGKFAEFISEITDEGGKVPAIGDDDEGRVLAGDEEASDYLQTVRDVIEGTKRHLGKEGLRGSLLAQVKGVGPSCTSTGIKTFRYGGYSVVRQRPGGREVMLVFDHGPLGYLGIAAHGHADALAIWLHVAGQPVLVDAGTYLYHSGGNWRRYFRGSEAHNTLVLGSSDQSTQAGNFNWASKARTRLLTATSSQLIAEHDGYVGKFGYKHRREIGCPAPGRFVVQDTLIGNGDLPCAEVGFLIAPNLEISETATGWSIARDSNVFLLVECAQGHRTVERGLVNPTRGWVSERFGAKRNAARLVVRLPRGIREARNCTDGPRMKIMLVHNYYQRSGGEEAVLESEMALLRSAGHDVSLYSAYNSEIVSPAQRLKVAVGTIYNWGAARAIAAHLRNVQPDIMHVHNFFPQFSPTIFAAAKKMGVATVLTLHNFRIFCPTGVLFHAGQPTERSLHGSPWWGVPKKVYRDSFAGTIALASMISLHKRIGTWRKEVDRFIALTNFAKGKFVEAGLPDKLVEVKGNSADAPSSESLPDADDRYGALYVGRLSPEKGPHLLVQAWRGVDYPLRIVGDGPLSDAMRSCGNPNIEFLGNIPRDAVRAEMLRAAFLIIPSVCYEMFPMVLAEAYGCALPIIAAKVGGLGDLVKDGTTGLHFDVADAEQLRSRIVWAISQPTRLAKMGLEARKEYEQNYTPPQNLLKLVRIYEHAIAAKTVR